MARWLKCSQYVTDDALAVDPAAAMRRINQAIYEMLIAQAAGDTVKWHTLKITAEKNEFGTLALYAKVQTA